MYICVFCVYTYISYYTLYYTSNIACYIIIMYHILCIAYYMLYVLYLYVLHIILYVLHFILYTCKCKKKNV